MPYYGLRVLSLEYEGVLCFDLSGSPLLLRHGLKDKTINIVSLKKILEFDILSNK